MGIKFDELLFEIILPLFLIEMFILLQIILFGSLMGWIVIE